MFKLSMLNWRTSYLWFYFSYDSNYVLTLIIFWNLTYLLVNIPWKYLLLLFVLTCHKLIFKCVGIDTLLAFKKSALSVPDWVHLEKLFGPWHLLSIVFLFYACPDKSMIWSFVQNCNENQNKCNITHIFSIVEATALCTTFWRNITRTEIVACVREIIINRLIW